MICLSNRKIYWIHNAYCSFANIIFFYNLTQCKGVFALHTYIHIYVLCLYVFNQNSFTQSVYFIHSHCSPCYMIFVKGNWALLLVLRIEMKNGWMHQRQPIIIIPHKVAFAYTQTTYRYRYIYIILFLFSSTHKHMHERLYVSINWRRLFAVIQTNKICIFSFIVLNSLKWMNMLVWYCTITMYSCTCMLWMVKRVYLKWILTT